MKNKLKILIQYILCFGFFLQVTILGQNSIKILEKTSTQSSSEGFFEKDWQDIIDNTWGAGLPTEEKLRIFDTVWKTIDEKFAAFHNLDFDIDEYKERHRPEIENGVSRGRFAAIMNHFGLNLMEAHTSIIDMQVNAFTKLEYGIPLFVIDTRNDNSHFGACLTPLPDSSLLVYKSVGTNALGMEPGDIVLGYEGTPWKVLYKELLSRQFPIRISTCQGSTDESFTHYLLQSAGMNWHLFNTIDIIKYETGDTVHIPTGRLSLPKESIIGNEQLKIAGVPMTSIPGNDFVRWGIVEGTSIGYIYVAAWAQDTQYQISQKFYDAIYEMMFEHQTSGLIVDFRLNHGGYMPVAHRGYSLLFNQDVTKVDYDVRGNPDDRYDMKDHQFFSAELFTIPGNEFNFYDKPIAILSGPAAVSNGDWETLRLRYHPNAKTFGKPTNGAYSSLEEVNLGNSNWRFYYTYGVGYLLEGHEYLSHKSIPVDYDVWFTPESVAEGKDNIAETAIEWINSHYTSVCDEKNLPDEFTLNQNFPNPFNPATTICFSLPASSRVKLKVNNLLGEQVAVLVNEDLMPGKHSYHFDAGDLTSGIYIYTICVDGYIRSRKMALLK